MGKRKSAINDARSGIEEALDSIENPAQRRKFLEENAAKVEDGNYIYPYTEEELVVKREEYTDKSVELAITESEFKELKADFQGRIKKAKEQLAQRLNQIAQGAEQRTGQLFYFDDQKQRIMFIYDETGAEVSRRPLRPDERQSNIMTAMREEQKAK